ncbi:MAG: hypothetical protein ABI946_04760 [Chthoniobacterales bacterium]
MSLESCPTCGYALSTLGNHCRHCAPMPMAAGAFRPFDAKHRLQTILALLALGVFVFLLFFR